jgi:hypothetical protein
MEIVRCRATYDGLGDGRAVHFLRFDHLLGLGHVDAVLESDLAVVAFHRRGVDPELPAGALADLLPLRRAGGTGERERREDREHANHDPHSLLLTPGKRGG